MFNLIKRDRYLAFTVISILCVLGWWFNFSLWHIAALYVILTVVYLLINSSWLGQVLGRAVDLEQELQFIFGLFLMLFLVGFGLAVPIFFYKLLPIYLLIVLLTLTIIISFLNRRIRQAFTGTSSLGRFDDGHGLNMSKGWLVIFSVLCLAALFFLLKARTGDFILSPWQQIRPYYLYLWLAIALLVGFFIFSRTKLIRILLIIILASLLMHAYLPIVYKKGFGGDKWRHLGAERSLMQGESYLPVLFGNQVSMKQVGPVSMPEVLVVGNKNSYVNMWGLTIALAWLLGLNVFWVDLLLGFLLYTIFFPLLLFKFGQLLFDKKKFLLLLAFLPFCFGAFQIYGSITVPNSFGFLWFLFVLWLILYGLKYRFDRYLVVAAVIGLIFSYFNYILYFILLLEIIVLIFLMKRIAAAPKGVAKAILWALLCIVVIGSCIIIPAADLVSNNVFKNVGTIQNLGNNMLDFGKRLIMSQPIFPRVNAMEQDNWLFTQVDQNLSRASALKLIRWSWVLAPLTLLLIIVGLFMRQDKNKLVKYFLILLLFIVMVNQFISVYFMDGNHVFNKRLVLLMSFLMMIFLALGIKGWLECKCFAEHYRLVALLIFLSLLSATVYVSGPKMQTVTNDELKAADYLWQKISINKKSHNYCVLANTWPLLALEGESARQIVTGGFPVYFEYAQPERVQLFDNINKNPSIKDIDLAMTMTKSSDCYVMTEDRWVYIYRKSEILGKLDKILGPSEKIGSVYLWHYKGH